jgi:hypothetical protein
VLQAQPWDGLLAHLRRWSTTEWLARRMRRERGGMGVPARRRPRL